MIKISEVKWDNETDFDGTFTNTKIKGEDSEAKIELETQISEKNYTFEIDSEYDYDPAKVEIANGKVKQKLGDNPNQDFMQDFSSDEGFEYDDSLSEITAGRLQQKDARPSGATMADLFTLGGSANWGNGILTRTLNGSAVIDSESLLIPTGTNNWAEYDALNNLAGGNIGAVRFRYKPTFSTPSVSQNLFYTFSSIGNLPNVIYILHNSNATLLVRIYDQSGNQVLSNSVSFTPTPNEVYEIELNWDITSGETRLFIDGVLQFTATQTGTRNLTTGYIRLGRNNYFSTNNTQEYRIEGLVLFNTVQHINNYTPNWDNIYEKIYVNNKVRIPQFSYSGFGSIIEFTNIVTTQSGTLRFIINDMYYNGGWVSSNGSYEEANDYSTMLANINSLPASDNINMDIVFTDSDTPSYIDELTLTYTGQTFDEFIEVSNKNGYSFSEAIKGFEETAEKPVGTGVKYQISDDDGTTWYYWGGTSWIVITPAQTLEFYYNSESNDASMINSNINSISTSGNFKFRAILKSFDASVELENVFVNFNLLHFGEGEYISKAYNYENLTYFKTLTKLIETPSNTELKLYVRYESNGSWIEIENVVLNRSATFFQWKIVLSTTDGLYTPSFDSLTLEYANIIFEKNNWVINKEKISLYIYQDKSKFESIDDYICEDAVDLLEMELDMIKTNLSHSVSKSDTVLLRSLEYFTACLTTRAGLASQQKSGNIQSESIEGMSVSYGSEAQTKLKSPYPKDFCNIAQDLLNRWAVKHKLKTRNIKLSITNYRAKLLNGIYNKYTDNFKHGEP